MAKAKDDYVAAMNIWLKQRQGEIDSCKRMIQQHRIRIRFAEVEASAARTAISLEEAQIAIARRGLKDGKRNLARHLKKQSV